MYIIINGPIYNCECYHYMYIFKIVYVIWRLIIILFIYILNEYNYVSINNVYDFEYIMTDIL